MALCSPFTIVPSRAHAASIASIYGMVSAAFVRGTATRRVLSSTTRSKSPKPVSSRRQPHSPFPYSLGVLRVMTVGVKSYAATEPRFGAKLIFRRLLDEIDEPAMGVVQLLQHLG